MANQPGKTEDAEEAVVDAVVTGYTSIRGRLIHPGLHKLPKSWAKMLQETGLARPPKKKPEETPAPSATPESKTETPSK